MADSDLKALLVHQLKDIYYAENAIVKALPKMVAAAKSDDLKSALGVHLEETRGQVKRLEEAFELLGQKPEGVPCKAIEGIIAEGEEVIREFGQGQAIDAGIIAAAQAVEHYEITRYGTLMAWARQLELNDLEDIFKETLVEEENTDEILSDLAESAVNASAAG